MARLHYTLEELAKMEDIGDVDTLTLFLNLNQWIPILYERRNILYNIKKVSEKESKGEITIKRNDGKIETLEDIYFNSKISNPYNKKMTFYSFSYRCITGYLKITLQHNVVLGHSESMIIKDIKKGMAEHFNIENRYLDNIDDYICLGRIDYKRDYPYRNLEEYYLIKQIIDIAPETIVKGYYTKKPKADTHRAYIVSYQTESNRTAEFTIYDKEKEQQNKLSKGEIDYTNYDKYRETIRFEVRILNAKLNALKYLGFEKSISQYKTKEMAEKLFNSYAEQAFFTEPIYRIDIAKDLVTNSNIKNNMKSKLCQLLEDINVKGYTNVRNNYTNSNKEEQVHNYTKFNRHIKALRELGINPLTFKNTWRDIDGHISNTKYKQIPNFILAENCREEEAFIFE